MHKLPVGVLGASGYAGRELCALVARHPSLDLAFATARAQRGETARISGTDVTFLAPEYAPLSKAEIVFSALPHGASLDWVRRSRAEGARVIDLSADLRPGNGEDGVPYGLTELSRPSLSGAELVSNPGCYATAILLALAPPVMKQLVRPGSKITISAASGVTGAGFTPRPDLLFAEVAEDFRAYSVGNDHRHLREMRAQLQMWGADNDLVFTPHLLPVARGILATIVVGLTEPLARPLDLWKEAYAGEAFIEVSESPPSLKEVVRRNVLKLSVAPAANVREPTLIITAAIDNLLKGAAGQAVQNANLMLGLPEQAGLPS